MPAKQIIQADLTWTGHAFERDVQILAGDDGLIDHVGATDLKPTHRLSRRALLPGFVNAHSHAFQRGLRGCGEAFPEGAGTFWTWRDAMYDLVEKMDADKLYELSNQAFAEMLACGITTVGEFHYLHHDESGSGFRLDEVLLTAANDAGIRLVLLNTYYRTGGMDQPATAAQQRFVVESATAFWRHIDELASKIDPSHQSLGVAAHSVRAVPLDEIVELHAEARKRGMVFHIHVEEQRREVDAFAAVHGKPPMAALCQRLEIDEATTAIHCTHTAPSDMKRFVAAGGNVCICPLTEANLGDGIADLPGIRDSGGHICLGTDSNARIGFTEEMRWLEYAQRLRRESRGVVTSATGDVASALLDCATVGGARSLGLRAGRIDAGHPADFVAIDLTAASLAGWSPETLLASFILGAASDAVASTCVGGRWTVPPQRGP